MVERKKNKILFSGQTAIELAIFGAILLFVLGLIVKTNLGYGLSQNHSLKVLRMAMTASLFTADQSACNDAGGNAAGANPAGSGYQVWCEDNGGRSAASVLFIEDRIMPDMSNKYGGLERTPLIAQGSAVFSPNLNRPMVGTGGNATTPCEYWTSINPCPRFLPLGQIQWITNPQPNNVNPDPGFNDPDIPRMDIFINGKQFPFTMAAISGEMWVANGYGAPCTWGPYRLYDSNCVYEDGSPRYGCPVFLKKTSNHHANDRWCDHDTPNLSLLPPSDWSLADQYYQRNCTINSKSNLPLNYRFDLDHTFMTDVNCTAQPDVPATGPIVNYENFSWQWMSVLGVDLDAEDMADQSKELQAGREGISVDAGINTNIDFDFDTKEERIVWVNSIDGGPIDSLRYLDFQNGDMDMSYDTMDYANGVPSPGIGREMRLISKAQNGTYLRMEEGKLYSWNPSQQYVRQTQRRDKVDVVERQIQLSNNTGRFCTYWPATNGTLTRPLHVDGRDNPVEICCDHGACTNGASSCMAEVDFTNVRTCMEMETRIIYVRSKVADRHGRKWITSVPDDSH